MTYENTIASLPDALEGLVDRHGLREILAALCTICGDKSAELEAMPIKSSIAVRHWNKAYKAIYKAHDATLHI